MKYTKTSRFKKDFKRIKKQNKDLEKLRNVINLLSSGEPLPKRFKEHYLNGKYSEYQECHIEPDWLLIYQLDLDSKVLNLVRTGSHSELFG